MELYLMQFLVLTCFDLSYIVEYQKKKLYGYYLVEKNKHIEYYIDNLK